MLRYRMNKLIHLLEDHPFDEVRDTVLAPENRKALNALIDLECVKPLHDWSGNIISLTLLEHSTVYELSRQEVWLNRLYGFIAGVAATVAGELIAYAVRGML